MTRLLDSSAIFRAIKENAIDRTADSHTLELARYELGNIVWKQHNLHKTINGEESLRLIRIIADVLDTLQIHHAKGKEDKILELAEETDATFYDASYLYHARELGLPLISEDRSIIEKARRMGITASTLREIL